MKQVHQDELNSFRAAFPGLDQSINDEPLIYFDNAATAQSPQVAIDAVTNYYSNNKANVHRGVHTLGTRSTELYDQARQTVADFIHAPTATDVIFTKGSTEGLNWVAQSFAQQLTETDEIIVSVFEHHANFLPWQRLAQQTGAKLVVIGLTPSNAFDWAAFEDKLVPQTKIVALTMMSNVTGTTIDMRRVSAMAHQVGAVVVADAAQAIVHMTIDVVALDVDYLVFSGHKLYGPMGIGVLYGKPALLNQIEPALIGGGMVALVTNTTAEWLPLPERLEAGTPNVGGAVGLAAVITWLQTLDQVGLQQHVLRLAQALLAGLAHRVAVTTYGVSGSPIISFNLAGMHPHDVATALDQLGIAVRAGHHCAQPLMHALGLTNTGTVRVSIAPYNTLAEVHRFLVALDEIIVYFRR
ncbi:aminotransferase class V-fold PLP-dependent enzyme [Weissella soli]|uniref:aminotransferase class V-fold PLP-dependent enzyme n=1 Tax=Weissella soli TaxID=155866 RepID=UPI001FAAB6A2|nr:cysteine desulfurase [Weissella soli]